MRKRCQLTLVKTKEQLEWEKFPEKLGLIRKPNPGKENKSKIPKMINTAKEFSQVTSDMTPEVSASKTGGQETFSESSSPDSVTEPEEKSSTVFASKMADIFESGTKDVEVSKQIYEVLKNQNLCNLCRNLPSMTMMKKTIQRLSTRPINRYVIIMICLPVMVSISSPCAFPGEQ